MSTVEAGVDSEESASAPRKTQDEKETTTCSATTEAMFDKTHEHTCCLEANHYDTDQFADHYCKVCSRYWYKKGLR